MRSMCEKGAKTSKIPEYMKTKEWPYGMGMDARRIDAAMCAGCEIHDHIAYLPLAQNAVYGNHHAEKTSGCT